MRHANPVAVAARASRIGRPLPLLALLLAVLGSAACTHVPGRDPLVVSVAGIEPLPSEGLELRLAVRVRILNPNDAAMDFTGIALALDLNERNLANGVSDTVGTIGRYGETVLTVPVTISAFDMARMVLGFINAEGQREVPYRVRGKLEGGLLGTLRFRDEGSFRLPES